MRRASRFEELVAWQRARTLVKECYLLCAKEKVRRDFAFCNRLTGAALSIMSHIAEGSERPNGEFTRHLNVSLASCAEVRCQTYTALDLGYCDAQEFKALMALGTETTRLTKALRSSVDLTNTVEN